MAVLLKSGVPSQRGSEADRTFLRMRGGDLLANIGLLGALWLAYSTVRGVTADHVSTAMDNASDLLQLQSLLGLPSELAIQQTFLDQTTLLKAANVHYIAVHFPVTLVFLGWVWLRHRERFGRIRDTLIGVTGVGLVLHVVYPLAPPRMIDGFVDTAAVIGPNPYDLKIAAAANQIAAMPSLHVGWSLLVVLGIVWILDSNWRYLAFVHPTLTIGVVVVTANHYWADAIVAATLVFIGWVVRRGLGGLSGQESGESVEPRTFTPPAPTSHPDYPNRSAIEAMFRTPRNIAMPGLVSVADTWSVLVSSGGQLGLHAWSSAGIR